MRLLLDSHVLLWYAAPKSPLKSPAIDAIRDADEVWVSAATIWELAIKQASGKLKLERQLTEMSEGYGFQTLAVSPHHGEAILSLPRLHRDPFDHLLLAQAKVEGLTLVTHDRILGDYGVPVLLV